MVVVHDNFLTSADIISKFLVAPTLQHCFGIGLTVFYTQVF